MHDHKGIKDNLLVTVEQLRAARALLGWSQTELASRAGLSLPTVKRVEGDFVPAFTQESRLKLERALEGAGVEFINENGGGPGVRLKKPNRKRALQKTTAAAWGKRDLLTTKP